MREVFVKNIKDLAKSNSDFRRVIYTGAHAQLVVMNIPAGTDIGLETHDTIDQMIVIVDGEAEVVINNDRQKVEEHEVVYVPAGALHNVTNTGDEDLKLYTVYAPPEHPDGTVHKTKAEAEAAEHAHH